MGTFLIFLVIAVAVGLGIIIKTQPDTFNTSRTATMNASAATIFENVNNLHKWEAWSPWAKLDPNSTSGFEGPEAGVGAVMWWSGNMQVGTGRMTITESRPNEKVKFRLDFEKPMRGTNNAEFTFEPNGDQTNLTWSMTGTNNAIAKVINLVMNCEKMVGGQFEKGLANLKGVVEK